MPDQRKQVSAKIFAKEKTMKILGLRRDYVTWPFPPLMAKEKGTWLQTIDLHMQVAFCKAVRSRSRCSSEKKLHTLLLSL